jgi:hypothetical protein
MYDTLRPIKCQGFFESFFIFFQKYFLLLFLMQKQQFSSFF